MPPARRLRAARRPSPRERLDGDTARPPRVLWRTHRSCAQERGDGVLPRHHRPHQTAGMRHRSGQGTVEYLTLVGCVAAVLCAAAATIDPGLTAQLVARASSALTLGRAPQPSARALAFTDRAIAGSPDGSGPGLRDAMLRLAAEIGPAAARALVVERALQRYLPSPVAGRLAPLTDPSLALARPDLNGLGTTTVDGAWSSEEPRSASTLRIVDDATEIAWTARLEPSLPERAIDLATAGLVAAGSAINPAAAAAAIILGAGVAATETAEAGISAGARADDAIVCRFVWRTNHADPGWVDAHLAEALRLRLDERVPAVDLSVVRCGRVITRSVVWSRATSC